MSQHVIVEKRDGIGRITLNRPEALNALSREMIEAIRAAVADFAASGEVKALLLAANGRAFCSGADLSDPMMGQHLPQDQKGAACAATLDSLMNAMIRELRDAPFPTVAAVNGIAAGGGVGLALALDMVVAARSANFILSFTSKLGLIPDLGASWHLPQHLGRARAMGLMLTGAPLSAEEAVHQGLIWTVVEDTSLVAEADALAAKLAAGPTLAQVATRQLVDGALSRDFSAQLDAERDGQATMVGTDDVAEAMKAFAEKRKPVFKGR